MGARTFRELATPAQTSLPVVIGVTGHRDLRAADVPHLEDRVREIFVGLKRQYPETSLLVLSPLAEGADRLVARVGLEQGAAGQPRARLIVPLPLPRSEYEKDFLSDESREEFIYLLAQAAEVFELPLMEGCTSENIRAYVDLRNRQYAQVGAYIVRHSQLLLALWDGVKSQQEGGTAEIVRFRLEGIPEPYTAPHNPLDARDTGLVHHILTPRVKFPQPSGEPFSLQIEFPGDDAASEAQRRTLDRVLLRTNAFNRDAQGLTEKQALEISQSRVDLIPAEQVYALPARARHLLDQYALADTLAVHFRQCRRHTLLALFGLALLAVMSFEIYAHLLGAPWMLALYPIFLGLGFLVYRWAKREDYQNKHLDYRALAEGLRVQLFWCLSGLPDEVADHYLRKQQSELEWIRNAIRACNVPAGGACAAPAQPSAPTVQADPQLLKTLVLPGWIEAQRDYFENSTERDHKQMEKRERAVNRLFIFGLTLAMLVVGLDFYLHHSSLYEQLHHWLIVLMGTAPAIAAALGGFAEKMAYAAQAKRYSWMGALFRRAGTQLDLLLKQNQVAEAQQLIRELGREALEENGDWVMIHRERELDLPKGG